MSVVALVFIGGAAMLFTEDESGQLTRLRIPGTRVLRLTDDAAGKLAQSRQQPNSRPGDRDGDQVGSFPARLAGRDRHRGNQPRQHG